MDFCFFLIGFKEFNKPLPDVGNVVCYCNNCHNQSAHALKSSNWVTLFFIPVIPFSFKKRLRCSICNASGDINDEVITRLRNGQPVAIGWTGYRLAIILVPSKIKPQDAYTRTFFFFLEDIANKRELVIGCKPEVGIVVIPDTCRFSRSQG